MKLFWLELRKLVCRKNFILLLIFLLLATFGIDFLQYDNFVKEANIDLYDEIIEEVSSLNANEQLSYINEQQQLYEKLDLYQTSLIIPVDEEILLTKEELDLFNELKHQDISALEYINMYSKIGSYYKNIYEYDVYIQKVKENVLTLKNSPMWNQYSADKKLEINQMAEVYEKLENQKLSPIYYHGVDAYANSASSKLLSLILICTVCILCFKEDEDYMNKLLLTTKHGKSKLCLIKILVISFVIFLSVTILQMGDFLFHMILYGGCDLTVPIQSIPALYESPYILSIQMWLIQSILVFSLVMVVLGILYAALYQIFQNKLIPTVLFCVFLFLEIIFFVLIKETSIFAILKNLNLIHFFSGARLYLYMPPVTLFNMQIPTNQFLYILCGIICLLSMLVYMKYYGNMHKKIFVLPQGKSNKKLSSRLWVREGYRLFIQQKAIVIIVVLCAYCGFTFYESYSNTEGLRANEAQIYEEYKPYIGLVDEQKEKILLEEYEKIQTIETEMDEATLKYSANEMEEINYQILRNEYQKDQLHRSMFLDLYDEYSLHPEVVTYPKGYQALYGFNNSEKDSKMAIIMIIAVAFLLCNIYGESKEEDCLYLTMQNGRKKRRSCKWSLAILITLFVFGILNLQEYLHFSLLYPLHQWNLPISGFFSSYTNITTGIAFDMSTLNYGILLVVTRLFGIIFVMTLAVYLSRLLKNNIIAVIVTLMAILFPMFLYFSGFEFSIYVSVFDMIMGNLFLQKTLSISKVVVLLALEVFMIIHLRIDLSEQQSRFNEFKTKIIRKIQVNK